MSLLNASNTAAYGAPSVVRTLVEKFGLCGIGNVEDDVKAIRAWFKSKEILRFS